MIFFYNFMAAMKILYRLYSIYAVILFICTFLIFFPFFILIIPFSRLHFVAQWINNIWARVFFILMLMPYRNEYRGKIDQNQQYIFCANHFSFLDIAVMGMAPVFALYTGKESISKVPLFGYMFKKLHITIDRSTSKGRYEAYRKYENALEEGKSLIIFPEGGIWSESPPRMSKFKDGPFKTAILKQIPIIPVTIPYNWIILPDDGKHLVHWHKCKVIYHEPVHTNGMKLEQMDELKQKVYNVIDEELKKQNSINR